MALDRTNMVSLFDVGSWLGSTSEKLVEMGDGFNSLSEDWGPSFKDTQYVNMKNSASSLNGYAFSMTPEREHLSDEMQKAINTAFKKFPTGDAAKTYYYRFYKSDITGTTGDCIRLPVVAGPSSTGGDAGDALTSSIEIHGNGEVEVGTITIGAGGTFSWAAKDE